jgi:hypothetical protein
MAAVLAAFFVEYLVYRNQLNAKPIEKFGLR